MGARKPWVSAAAGLLIVVGVIVFVLAAATVGVPSEVSLPLIVLAAIAARVRSNYLTREGRARNS